MKLALKDVALWFLRWVCWIYLVGGKLTHPKTTEEGLVDAYPFFIMGVCALILPLAIIPAFQLRGFEIWIVYISSVVMYFVFGFAYYFLYPTSDDSEMRWTDNGAW